MNFSLPKIQLLVEISKDLISEVNSWNEYQLHMQLWMHDLTFPEHLHKKIKEKIAISHIQDCYSGHENN